MSIKTLLGGLAALTLLGACATATPYQSATDSQRGFSEQRIEQDRFLVQFAGNSLTDRRTVETYLLYRAAELTAQNGFDHFRVVERNTEADERYVASGFSDAYGYGFAPYYGHFYPHYNFYGPRGYWSPAYYGGRYYYPSRFRAFSHYDPFWGGPSEYRKVTRYEASAEILMGRGPKPADPAYFDAREVLENIGPHIQRPDAS